MDIRRILEQPHAWTSDEDAGSVAISSRVRLARNLQDAVFPGWAADEERVRVWNRLRGILCGLSTLPEAICVGNDELSEQDRLLLFERHLISREHVERERGSGIVMSPPTGVVIMVNEEDHLRMQALRPGLRLLEAWETIDRVDTELDGKIPYAFSSRWGYLTACPTNVGTGIRASVMLHLPGLVLMEQIGPLIKGVSKIGLAVRGLWGEGTDAQGNMFQISNQVTLGDREEDIVRNLEQVVREIIGHEENARARLWRERQAVLLDHVGRAVGILLHAHVLSSREAVDLLSALRLGVDMGIVDGVERRTIHALMLLTQPAHLQARAGRPLEPFDRDQARAALVREMLGSGLRMMGRRRRKSS